MNTGLKQWALILPITKLFKHVGTKKYHIDNGFFLRHSFANKGIASIKLEHTLH